MRRCPLDDRIAKTLDNSGGAIGAGLFIGSGGAFQNGGPGSVLLGFMIIGEL
jgi:amino acid permease